MWTCVSYKLNFENKWDKLKMKLVKLKMVEVNWTKLLY